MSKMLTLKQLELALKTLDSARKMSELSPMPLNPPQTLRRLSTQDWVHLQMVLTDLQNQKENSPLH